MYNNGGYVWYRDGEWRVVRTIPRYDSMYVWNDELICCGGSAGLHTYSIWSVSSWKPILHPLYPEETRDAIRTWLACSRTQHLPRDVVLVIVGMLADCDPSGLVRTTTTSRDKSNAFVGTRTERRLFESS